MTVEEPKKREFSPSHAGCPTSELFESLKRKKRRLFYSGAFTLEAQSIMSGINWCGIQPKIFLQV